MYPSIVNYLNTISINQLQWVLSLVQAYFQFRFLSKIKLLINLNVAGFSSEQQSFFIISTLQHISCRALVSNLLPAKLPYFYSTFKRLFHFNKQTGEQYVSILCCYLHGWCKFVLRAPANVKRKWFLWGTNLCRLQKTKRKREDKIMSFIGNITYVSHFSFEKPISLNIGQFNC